MGEQAGSVGRDQFHHGALVKLVQLEFKLCLDGEVLILARCASRDLPAVAFPVVDFIKQGRLDFFNAQVVFHRFSGFFQHMKGVQNMVVCGRGDAGIDNIQSQLVQHGGYAAELVIPGRCEDENFGATPIGYRLNIDDTAVICSACQQAGVMRYLLGRMTQEIFITEAVPQSAGVH